MTRQPPRYRAAGHRRGRFAPTLRALRTRTKRRIPGRRLTFEPLETRRMLAVMVGNSTADPEIEGDRLDGVGVEGQAGPNVAPVLTVADNQISFEGQLLDLTGISAPLLALFIDPGDEGTHLAAVDWGGGAGFEPVVVFFDNGAGAISGSHTYQTAGKYAVRVRVADQSMSTQLEELIIGVAGKDFVEQSFVVDVASITSPVFENGTATLDGTYSESLALLTYELDIDWDGDGQYDETVPLSGGTFQLVHPYLDDDPTGTPSDEVTVNVRLRDSGGRTLTATTSIIVNNVSPMVDGLSATDVGDTGFTTLSGNIDDPGSLDTFTLMVDWGDGSGVETFTYAAGMTSFNETHEYADDNSAGTMNDSYTISVTLIDDDGGSDTASVVVDAAQPLPPIVDLNGDEPGVNAVFQAFRRSTIQIGAAGRTVLRDADSEFLSSIEIEIGSPVGAVSGTLAVNLAIAAARGIHVIGQNTDSLTLEAISNDGASLADFQAVLETLQYIGGGATAAAEALVTVTAVDIDGQHGSAQAIIQFINGPFDQAARAANPTAALVGFRAGAGAPNAIVPAAALRSVALRDGGPGSGGGLPNEENGFESPDRLAAAERALRRALTRPESASRTDVIDVVFSLGDVELASLLGIDMGDEPVYHETRKEQVNSQADDEPEPPPTVASNQPEPTRAPAAEFDASTLTLWGAIAGSGMLWLGGTWWWMDRRRRRRLHSKDV